MARTLAALAAAAALTLALAAAAQAWSLPRSHAASQKALVRATLTPHHPAGRLPRSFLGLSVEYPNLFEFVGNSYSGVNPLLANLFGLIRDAGSGVPLMRIGGGSTDSVFWNPDNRPRPPGITFSVTPEWASSANAFQRAVGSRFMLGLNLGGNVPSYATDWAKAATAALGRSGIESFEVGNEPDLYFEHLLQELPDGKRLIARPRGYSFEDYLREYRSYATQLRAAQPGIQLSGPAVCCYLRWFNAKKFVHLDGRIAKDLTYHLYPASACKPALERNAFQQMLGPGVQTALALRMYKASKAGKPLRITETNSASCGGAIGLSNAFASSLWSIDWLFTLWSVGVDGVNFHAAPETRYTPFQFDYDYLKREWRADIRPLYYGLLFFARATANRARLLPDVTATALTRPKSWTKVWATIDGHRTGRFVVDNKDGLKGGPVILRVPGARAPARLTRLSAPAIDATDGVTLAGQRFDAPSKDAVLKGDYQQETVVPRHGVYRFDVPVFSAALLEVPHVR
jgi:hypothetical protein